MACHHAPGLPPLLSLTIALVGFGQPGVVYPQDWLSDGTIVAWSARICGTTKAGEYIMKLLTEYSEFRAFVEEDPVPSLTEKE